MAPVANAQRNAHHVIVRRQHHGLATGASFGDTEPAFDATLRYADVDEEEIGRGPSRKGVSDLDASAPCLRWWPCPEAQSLLGQLRRSVANCHCIARALPQASVAGFIRSPCQTGCAEVSVPAAEQPSRRALRIRAQSRMPMVACGGTSEQRLRAGMTNCQAPAALFAANRSASASAPSAKVTQDQRSPMRSVDCRSVNAASHQRGGTTVARERR